MLLNLILIITTIAMLAVLALTFFAVKLRGLLRSQLYFRTFSFFAVLAIAGIILASVLSLSMQGNKHQQAITANVSARF